MKSDWGRRLLGLCALVVGAATLIWHQLAAGGAPKILWSGPWYEFVLYVSAIAFIAGGMLIQFARTVRLGATLLAAILAFFAMLGVFESAAEGAISTSWIQLFETLGIFCGALVVFARSTEPPQTRTIRGARLLFGVCVVTYALAQIWYFQYTASLVPKWIPPNQSFWAALTTIAFGLAAIAILTGRFELAASELLTLMLVIFGVAVWVPAIIAHPEKLSNWTEITTNFGDCAGAWILADWFRWRAFAHSTGSVVTRG